MNTPTCYALRRYTYDYYEWQEDIAVSFDESLLIDLHKQRLNHLYNDDPIYPLEDHKELSLQEKPHWVITPIVFLDNTNVSKN
tara:strand:- start:280 stop:528 length:249 start_codon:yes stop_codon:yes gene_type:complete